MNKKITIAVKSISIFFVFALGVISIIASGGGGGGGGGGGSTDTTAAAGLWHGTLTDRDNNTFIIGGVISTEGQLRFVVDEGLCTGTQYAGTLTLNGDVGSGSFTGFAVEGCLFKNGTMLTSGTFDLTATGDNVTGTYTADGDSGTFTLTNNNEVEEKILIYRIQPQRTRRYTKFSGWIGTTRYVYMFLLNGFIA